MGCRKHSGPYCTQNAGSRVHRTNRKANKQTAISRHQTKDHDEGDVILLGGTTSNESPASKSSASNESTPLSPQHKLTRKAKNEKNVILLSESEDDSEADLGSSVFARFACKPESSRGREIDSLHGDGKKSNNGGKESIGSRLKIGCGAAWLI